MAASLQGFAQTNKEKAHDKGHQALDLEDDGKYDEAIKLLEEAQKLDPQSITYPYELAYAYYDQGNYKKAQKYLECIIAHPDVDDQVFQLLGNCYDNLGKSEKALEMYDAGLSKFPKSGKLFLEKGNVWWVKKEYNKALTHYEEGIDADPGFPSNYYRAALLYCSSTEQVWGMIYGEIFMNLERNSKRTQSMSKLLYNTYKSQIEFRGDTSYAVSFSKNATIDVSDLMDTAKFKLPFGIGAYEPTLMIAMLGQKKIDINSLDQIRSKFVDIYFQNGNSTKYPNILFDYQKKVKDAGHLEAYNHWLLMKGDEDGFDEWYSSNKEKYESFAKWFIENGMLVDEDHKFSSSQYW